MKTKITTSVIIFCMINLSALAAVRIDGTGMDFATIQSAVDASNNVTLIVTTGTYTEAVNIYNKNITIDGNYNGDYSTKAGSGSTIINPPGGSVFDITNSVIELIDLEIQDASGGFGGGLDLRGNSVVTTRQCRIHDLSGTIGGGAFLEDSSLVLIDTPIYNNSATGRGGGIYAESSQITLDGKSMVSFNTANKTGGGIHLNNNSRCDLINTDADLKDNFAPEGGAVSAKNSDFYIGNGADIIGNTAATRGGAILLENGSSATIYGDDTVVGWYSGGNKRNGVTNGNGGVVYAADSTITVSNLARFVNNYASGNGGGIYLTNSSALIDNALIGWTSLSGTNMAGGAGGGIFMLNSSLIVTNGGVIQRGYAGALGGGIFAQNSTIGLYDGSVLGNTDATLGNFASVGGGLLCEGSTVRCDNVQIVGNFGVGGGGGAVFINTNDVTIVNSSIDRNFTDGDAGGIFTSSTAGRFILDNTEVVSNIAVNNGAGIYWASLATLEARNGSRICDNIASSTVGGVFFPFSGKISFRDTEISGNKAMNVAGGIASAGDVSLVDCMINGNSGDADGDTNGLCGGIFVSGGNLDIIASNSNFSVVSNSAESGGGIYAIGTRVSIKAFPGRSCNIDGNSVIGNGGGMYFSDGSTVTISGNVSIDMNSAKDGGGIFATNGCVVSLFPANGSSPVLRNNSAANFGGGLTCLGPDTTINFTNVVVKDNNAYAGGAAASYSFSELTAINCKFIDNKATSIAGAIFAAQSKITIDSDFNIAPPSLLPPTIFQGNSATNAAGIYTIDGVDIYVADSLFVSNKAHASFGAIAVAGSTGKFVNVIVANNNGKGKGDGFALNANLLVEIQNCTIANNFSNGVYQGESGSPAHLQSCIVWGHLGYQISTNLTAEFSDIQDGFPGLSNIFNNPLFINPATLNYQVLGASESIDKGMTIASLTNDCIGRARPFGLGWDMGAYEFIPEPMGIIFMGVTFIIICLRRH